MSRKNREEGPAPRRRPAIPKGVQTVPSESDLAPTRAQFLVDHDVSRETLSRLDIFVRLLMEWQARMNLVAPSTLGDVWQRHIADSLPFAKLAPTARHWVDLGSGGGFPGLVIGIVQAERGGAVSLIESNDRKAAFLRGVIAKTGISGTVHAARIEDCGAVLGRADAVSARALASLDMLLGFVAGHIRPDIPCYFAKGRQHDDEITDASAHWRFSMVKHSSYIEAGAAILEVRDIEALAAPAR